MKNQNTKHKLVFNKAIVTELNDNQLVDINGGSGLVCIVIKTIIETRVPIIA